MTTHSSNSPLHLTWRARKEMASAERRTAIVRRLWNSCPETDYVSDYDVENLMVYACLLDAEVEGANLYEMARIIFGISPVKETMRAELVAASHLKRAHWMLKNGFPFLLW